MIEVSCVSKSFGDVIAVSDVSFAVPAGSVAVLVGPSGSGKTTLLRLIAGLEEPDAGEISMGGRQVSRPGWAVAPHQRSIGFVFQSPALWPHMTAAQNVMFGLQHLPRPEAAARLAEALERTSCAHVASRYPAQISGGEARRVALARALAPRPDWLLMDEPLTNLDGDLRAELLELVAGVAGETGAGMIYVTHDRGEAARLSDRPLLLRAGRLVTGGGGEQAGGGEGVP